MSYWKTMPVIVHETMNEDVYKPIVSKEFLLDKINKELAKPHIPFTHKIYEGNKVNDKFYNHIKLFFDNEYSYDRDTHMIYHKDIYKFFMKDSLILVLYEANTKDVIGYMVGKHAKITINSKVLDMLEVSFFCIARQFRNKHYTPYFINILLREYILRYGIYMGTYAISTNIRSPHYANKTIIHKPLNVPKLIQCEFLPTTFNHTLNFETDNSVDVIYLNNVSLSDKLIQIITYKLQQYQARNYTVYNDLSFDDIKRMFENKAFHNFIVFNKDKTIRDFVSLYEVEIKVDKAKTSYMSSSIYAMFFENNSIPNIRVVLEMVAEQCKRYNILDVLSFFDIFPVKDYEKELKCLYGQGTVK